MEEIRYKIVCKTSVADEFRSLVVPPSSLTSLVYKIGVITTVPDVCKQAGYYPTVFHDIKSVKLFYCGKFGDYVLECVVEDQVLPMPSRLSAYWKSFSNPRVVSNFHWPIGTEMWKIVKPIRVIPLEELEAMLNIL